MTLTRLCIAVLLAMALIILPAVANQVVNGDFETGTIVGWTTDWGNVSVTAPAAYNSTYGANLSSLRDDDYTRIYQEEIDFDDAAYKLSFALNITGPTVYPLFRVMAQPFDGDAEFVYSRSTKTTGWEIIEIDSSAYTGNYTIQFDVESQDQNATYAYVDNIMTDPRYVTAAFTSDKTTGPALLNVQFTDNSVNNPTAWVWNFTNSSTTGGNGTPFTFSTAKNPLVSLGPGNYSIALNASNIHWANTSPGPYWVNVSASDGGTTLIIIILNYIHQLLGYLPAALVTGG